MAAVDFSRYKRLVQYFWDPEPVNDTTKHASIWCLGVEYISMYSTTAVASPSNPSPPTRKAISLNLTRPVTPPESLSSSVGSASSFNNSGNEDRSWPLGFLDDFEAKISFTYRSGFPPIPRNQDLKSASSPSLSVRLRSQLVEGVGFTSDTGWGCMIRSGQSLLANALVILRLGRDWRRGLPVAEEKKILSLFADDPQAPYSIHKFVQHGEMACGKHPGEWFGPSATARCIQALANAHECSDLRIYMTGDGLEVYENSFMSIAKPDGINFKPTLILIGTRLGLDQVTPVYWEALKGSLKMPQSLGIAGGQPASSHYFIGVQGSHFFYLDPHHAQPALRFPEHPDDYTKEEIDSCHTRRLRKIDLKEMDPSMLIAFLIRNDDDWKDWRRAVTDLQGKAIIHVSDSDPAFLGPISQRSGAIDEVETFDDEDEDEEIHVKE